MVVEQEAAQACPHVLVPVKALSLELLERGVIIKINVTVEYVAEWHAQYLA